MHPKYRQECLCHQRRQMLRAFVPVLVLVAQAFLPVFAFAQMITIAGRSIRGYDGDGGPATAAALAFANLQNTCDPNRFEQTSHLTVDTKGNIYFTDSNNQRIRRIDPSGNISTVAGTGEVPATNARCEPTGFAAASFFNPADVIVHPDGNLIIADQQNNRIRQITPA